MIFGHGSEYSLQNDRTFIVPDDCYIVVSSRKGSYGSQTQQEVNMKALKTLQEENADLLSNPAQYSSEIESGLPTIEEVPKLGKISQSIIIYGPKSECPNFSYNLFDKIWFNGQYGVKCINGPSMDASIDELIPLDWPITPEAREKKEDEVRDDVYFQINEYLDTVYMPSVYDSPVFDSIYLPICMQYIASVEPTMDHVFNSIEDILHEYMEKIYYDSDFPITQEDNNHLHRYVFENSECSFHNPFISEYLMKHEEKMMTHIKEKLSVIFITTQSALCNAKPGVYYNFVCRAIPGLEQNVSNEGIQKILEGPFRTNVRSNVTRIKSPRLSKSLQKILMNRVGESRMTAKIQHNVYYTKKSQDKLHKQISTRKAIIKKDIDVMDKQQALLHTRKRALEKELVQLDHTAKRLHNNYTHYIKTRNTKGSYTKVHGKWVTKKNTP